MGVLECYLSLQFSYISQLSVKDLSPFVSLYKLVHFANLRFQLFKNALIIHKEYTNEINV